MRRPVLITIAFLCCLAVVFAAMAWVSVRAIRLDEAEAAARKAEAEARRDEAQVRQLLEFEEDVRLSLSRMDSLVAPLLMQENARPYFYYRAFYSPQRAYTEMFTQIEPSKILVPSPLLTYRSRHLRLHFQIEPDGTISSPQVPQSNMRDVAEAQFARHEQIVEAEAELKQLRAMMTRDTMLARLPAELSPLQKLERDLILRHSERQSKSQSRLAPRTQQEIDARNQSQQAYADDQVATKAIYNKISPISDVHEGVMRALWFGNELVLARRVTINGKDYVQGAWLDWPHVQDWLAGAIRDVFPEGKLAPLLATELIAKPRMLASFPAKLVVEPPAAAALPIDVSALDRENQLGLTAIQATLAVAWACTLLAAAAVGVLLLGAVALSERRGAFVSAVTHELRTPLTTFRMYTEMLENQMVPDEARRQEYLTTMRREADRLSHLVENVLAYARLERSSPKSRAQTMPVRRLFERVTDRLSQRAEQVGMKVDVQLNGAAEATVHADPAAVEQILFNLVDNACKYAQGADDPTIHVDAGRDNGHIRIDVRDHGPGIGRSDAGKLFQPFRKSAKEAAHSAPGVGLGLALSRRLAQAMGGNLKLVPNGDGAKFELMLPTGKAVNHG